MAAAAPSGVKLFVGGIPLSTSEDMLRGYFFQFGQVNQCELMQKNGISRGFGFVTFATQEAADRAMQTEKMLDGRRLEARPAVPREVLSSPQHVACKLFVGGLAVETTPEELRSYFSSFGEVTEALVMTNSEGTSRGFGFVTFASEAAADSVVAGTHTLRDRRAEIKKAVPKRDMEKQRSERFGGPGGYDAAPYGYFDDRYGGYGGYGRPPYDPYWPPHDRYGPPMDPYYRGPPGGARGGHPGAGGRGYSRDPYPPRGDYMPRDYRGGPPPRSSAGARYHPYH